MEIILEILKELALSDAVPLWGKALLLLLIPILSGAGWIWGKHLKKKARAEKARREKQRDKEQDIVDNNRTEDQHSEDGRSVRDRLKRGK